MCYQTRPFVIDIDLFPSRFRLPPHEAIIHELDENNYEESIRYLRELFELDDEIRREAGPDTLTWMKPHLKNNKDALLRLRDGLIAVERAKNAGAKENLKFTS